MSKLSVLRDIFADIQYRAGQRRFLVQTRFDNERSAIQIVRESDKEVIFRNVVEVKNNDRKFLRSDIEKSQIEAYSHFISYMSFYGIYTVEYSHDEEKKEQAIEKEELAKENTEAPAKIKKERKKKKDESL